MIRKKILLCFGTRPEYLKLNPLIQLLNKDQYDILYTGQQINLFQNLNATYSLNIESSHNRLNDIVSSCLKYFPDIDFDSIIIQGDTASAFACALSAFHLQKKIIYIESGLRTNNLFHPFPEEGYRQMISRIADIHFCPTELSKQNLLKENIAENRIYIVGNTSLDNIVAYKDKCYYGDKILITLHRRENLPILKDWISKINQCVEQGCGINEYIWPLHPNPEIQKLKNLIHPKIQIVNPLDHEEMINLMVECKFIITDSGGVQEEGCFFNKKIIVCRKNTERPEGIETGHLFICEDPTKLLDLFRQTDRSPWIKPYQNYCPYGDGHASKKILEILNKL